MFPTRNISVLASKVRLISPLKGVLESPVAVTTRLSALLVIAVAAEAP